MQVKKYLVLGVLFILPLSMYMFFASGKDNFGRLPLLTENVNDVSNFLDITGKPVTLQDKITVLGFFGKNPIDQKASAFNLAHKIYKKNREFQDFQFLFLVENGTQNQVIKLKEQIGEIADPEQWIFAFGTSENIDEVFNSLKTNYSLNSSFATSQVFIIDKELNLRGRKQDEDVGVLFGFDASDYSEINNKMGDDVKIILAEYRLALKKYKADREI
ncbi:hypothetical protein [Patiriisocius hiemis]|uniref:Uncharacterized protein n=1 Tax=Patiriisocius hiemis TaxID=3075604 RepID=A0ABU2YAK7_9FLAO|nr:hypothetical protein [Constantimarinum sp. W242]MDT0555219.1 hypothetical protein [Constantimarinum sp. W242]